jgi:hypothetical protein
VWLSELLLSFLLSSVTKSARSTKPTWRHGESYFRFGFWRSTRMSRNSSGPLRRRLLRLA